MSCTATLGMAKLAKARSAQTMGANAMLELLPLTRGYQADSCSVAHSVLPLGKVTVLLGSCSACTKGGSVN